MEDPSAPPLAQLVTVMPPQYNPSFTPTPSAPEASAPPYVASEYVYNPLPAAGGTSAQQQQQGQYYQAAVYQQIPPSHQSSLQTQHSSASGPAYPLYPGSLPPHTPTASSSSSVVPTAERGTPPPTVTVTIPNAEIVTEGSKKPYVVFEILFRAGDVQHTLLKRYSDLRKIHDQLASRLGAGCPLPEFPPAPWFTDHTKPEHMARRRKELIGYFNALVREPQVLLLPTFHELMEMSSETAKAMQEIGDFIVAARMERKRAELERQRQAQAERLRRMREDYEHSQTFHRDRHMEVWVNGAQMLYPRVLTYGDEKVFNLREQFWSYHGATIKGPDGHPWFQIMKVNPSFFHFRDCQYSIYNMQGEPLIFLQECWKFMARKYKIYRMLTAPNGRQAQCMFKLCSIKRAALFGIVEYEIKVASPSTSSDCHACRKSAIKCEGSWGDWDTTFTVGGRKTAHVGRNFAFMTRGDYDVRIAPGQDVVLYLALAVCIDKMHYEATRRH